MVTAAKLKYFTSLKQKKYRQQEKKFLIEGFHLIEECLNSEYVIDIIIVRNNVDLKHHSKIENLINSKQITVEYIPENSFNKISETESSQGIIGVVNIPAQNADDLTGGNLIIALDRINDPGNLGTIIRTAYWFGADKILISENSADVYNSKVLRSSQGAVFNINLINEVNLEKELSILKDEGYNVYLLTPAAVDPLNKLKSNPKSKSVFVFGNESDGISVSILSGGYEKLKIEGYTECESLNVAVSSGIVLHYITNLAKIV